MAGSPGILERFSLQGRVAVVSGGSGPLFGSSISEALAEARATVVSASRSMECNESFVAGLPEQGHDVHAAQLDITDTDSITALSAHIHERFGGADILVKQHRCGPPR